MKLGTIRRGWTLKYVAHSPVELFKPDLTVEPKYDIKLKRYVKQPRLARGQGLLYAICQAGEGVEIKDRQMTGKCPKSCSCQGPCKGVKR